MKKRIMSILLIIISVISVFPTFALGAEEVTYITDGLVSRYDGAMNTEEGHDADATVWQDLAGDNDITLAKTQAAYFTEDAFHISKKQFILPKELLSVVNGKAFTVELSIGSFVPQGSSFATLMCNDKNDNFSIFLRTAGDYIEFKSNSNARPKVTGGKEYIADSTVTITFEMGKSCSLYVDGVCIMSTVPQKTVGADGNLILGHADASRYHTTDYKGIRFYNRALSAEEVIQNAKADGNFDDDYVLPMPFIDVKQPKTNIIGDVALIERLENAAQLDAYADDVVPSTVILFLDDKLDVLDAAGKVIGSLDDVLAKLDGIIPAFSLKTAATGNALVEYVNKVNMQDAFVISADAAIIKAVRSECPMLRGVLDFTDMYANGTPDAKMLLAIRRAVNTAPCRIALLPENFSNSDTIQTLNNLQITTWLSSKNTDRESDILTELLSGAYGIVTKDAADVYAVANERLAPSTMTRVPLNIGHRGYPGGSYPENSLEGAKEAYQMGANAIEVDIYLTADGKLAVCHNSTTAAIFDKNLTVESSKISDLRKLKFKGFEDQNYCMPMLDEYFAEFKGKDVLIVVEIKSSNNNIVTVLKDLIERYDMYGQCYIITFSRSGVYEKLSEVMPEMPVGYLISTTNGISGSEALRAPLSNIQKYNTTYNPSKGGHTDEFTRLSILRGMMTNPWTINDQKEIYSYVGYGHSSITSDHCNVIGALTKKITLTPSDGKAVVTPGSALTYTVNAENWARSTTDVTNAAKVEILEGQELVTLENGKLTFGEKEGKVVLLASYTAKMGDASYTLYDQPIEISIQKPTVDQSVTDKPMDCSSFSTEMVLILGGIGVVAIIAVVAVMVILKKKRTK